MGRAVALGLLLLGLLGLLGPALSGGCPKECLCASNLLSCSKASLRAFPSPLPPYVALLDLSHNELGRLRSDWAPSRLPRLHSLLLSHNGLSFVSSEAFGNVPHLRYLDLSSNALAALGENLFSRLAELEVLLLYGNRIATIDRSAFEEMGALRKLYLSHNRIARFPLELVRKGEAQLPQLALLDLSANEIKHLSAEELGRLPAWVKNGLYLHANPLACRCDLYHLFTHWHKRQLSPAVDFEEELRCLHDGQRVRISRLSDPELMNCSEFKERALEVHRGEKVTINCDTRQRGATVWEWLTPRYERVPQDRENGSMMVLANGSLQIANISLEDMGPYTCYAVSQVFNETLYVHVTVHNYSLHGVPDTLNTAYTTLVGCILSVVLVLIYLYLTPCRCWCRNGEKQTDQHEDSINSSVLSTTPNHNADGAGGKEGSNRHTGSSGVQGQNGKCKPNSSPQQGVKGGRKMSDQDSVSSVFSDTPIVGGSQNEGGRGGSRDKGGAELVGLL
ncbi:amphoterin-induced protein 1 [Sceloporus undulatus]|uniref:amphoterin-induced protein 1 n=1 Tax=Sceloporus undulatus TaxID=8520 RepID=UPI001C4DD356|nr:amphoterin-induced protein 1 [Sceloporus undulatus]